MSDWRTGRVVNPGSYGIKIFNQYTLRSLQNRYTQHGRGLVMPIGAVTMTAVSKETPEWIWGRHWYFWTRGVGGSKNTGLGDETDSRAIAWKGCRDWHGHDVLIMFHPWKKVHHWNIKLDTTNLKHLELYSVMGEHDNAGFPLTDCLLSMSTAIESIPKRLLWAKCLCDKYGIELKFIHIDKDMAEIGCSKMIWTTKINLCWWHLWWAVRTQLAKGKLPTTSYNLDWARAEYQFIGANFIPPGTCTDIDDYDDTECKYTLLKMQIFSILHINPNKYT